MADIDWKTEASRILPGLSEYLWWPSIRDALARNLKRMYERGQRESADTELVDWMEGNIDELEVRRDLSAGTRVEIGYCSVLSGCPCGQKAKTIRDALRAAIEQEKGR